MQPHLTLVSHALCPYVQRAAIALIEKDVDFERITIDLADKPAWFKTISPLGRVPLLKVDGEAVLFESAAICEYLEDTTDRPLHPPHPAVRARHRAWMEFGSNVLTLIAGFYNAADADALQRKRHEIRERFATLEAELSTRAGPYFGGERFSLVDAVFAPVFRYFERFEAIEDFGFFDGLPRVLAWRQSLAQRPSVQAAAHPDYARLLDAFLRARRSELSRRMAA
ncbi:glutathione S-transferase family protein [Piscinibacter terrae]|uniref:glutathione transferase n=1 Tax=Piscinibacter terrae TaxID=2496871 RepID=A0A3N7HMK7_9BURK|nr:glutathione S-transferase family protein [Albitalea terrae]RQP22306.1 glutathione S-transferase family protein [Albitalea terrae]